MHKAVDEQIAQPAEAAASHLLLDRAHLASQTMGMADLQAEVLQMFIELAPTYIAAICEVGDKAALMAAAHTLKGASRGIGAFRLGQISEDFERQADRFSDGSSRETRAATEQLRQAFDATRSEIDAVLAEMS